jgi:hypothetical protein
MYAPTLGRSKKTTQQKAKNYKKNYLSGSLLHKQITVWQPIFIIHGLKIPH